MDSGSDAETWPKDVQANLKESLPPQTPPLGGDPLKQNLGIVELRIQMKRLQPKAPGWNKASKLAIPSIRIVPWKITLFDALAPHKRPQPKVLWKKSFLFAEIRLQKQQVFPNTPAWSPGQKFVLPRLSLGLKSSEPLKPKKAEKPKQSQTQGMGHSH